ncbi:tetratricopeptide repeat protein [Streptomyces sp. NPDC048330]|uniref:tetratricopeptide repeat protein n=1 Tax=Streptomyces sp. NPDC048330 TaxID=3365533 RepID=UPI0037103BF2
MLALNNVEAMLLADRATGTANPDLDRQRLLLRAALADRTVLGLGEHASDDTRAQAQDAARALLDWDCEHDAHAGLVAADASQWTEYPVGYVRQEYGAHLERIRQPLLGDATSASSPTRTADSPSAAGPRTAQPPVTPQDGRHMSNAYELYGQAAQAYDAGRFSEAAGLYERAVAGLEAERGPDADATLQALLEWGLACYNLGQYDEAEAHQRRALDGRIRTLGSDHGDTLNTRARLAEAIGAQDRFAEAEALARENIALGEAKDWGLHQSVIASRLALAWLWRRQECWAQAAVLARDVVDQFRPFGEDYPYTLASRHLLATCLRHTGDLPGAEEQAVLVYQQRTQKLGSEHPHTIAISLDLARILCDAGRGTEARPLAEQTLATATHALGDGHPHTLGLRELLSA